MFEYFILFPIGLFGSIVAVICIINRGHCAKCNKTVWVWQECWGFTRQITTMDLSQGKRPERYYKHDSCV